MYLNPSMVLCTYVSMYLCIKPPLLSTVFISIPTLYAICYREMEELREAREAEAEAEAAEEMKKAKARAEAGIVDMGVGIGGVQAKPPPALRLFEIYKNAFRR
jgi:hypothetical protein